MSSFKEEVEKTRQMLENVNRRLTGTDDVVYFRPPIQIRLKKTNPNKSFKSFTSNYKTKTFDKLEYDRKKYIEFVCKHPDCDYDIITVFKVKSKILPENVYIFSSYVTLQISTTNEPSTPEFRHPGNQTHWNSRTKKPQFDIYI